VKIRSLHSFHQKHFERLREKVLEVKNKGLGEKRLEKEEEARERS
jgi:hypothetical protein